MREQLYELILSNILWLLFLLAMLISFGIIKTAVLAANDIMLYFDYSPPVILFMLFGPPLVLWLAFKIVSKNRVKDE